MKKFLILLVFLLTGCVSNPDFNQKCTLSHQSNDISSYDYINVIYDNNDTILSAIYTKGYKALNDNGKSILKDVKEASQSYDERYYDVLEVSISKDSDTDYEVNYNLDVKSLSDDVLNDFKLKKNSVKFFRSISKEGFTCKKV